MSSVEHILFIIFPSSTILLLTSLLYLTLIPSLYHRLTSTYGLTDLQGSLLQISPEAQRDDAVSVVNAERGGRLRLQEGDSEYDHRHCGRERRG